ncbi:hypothetical protein EJ06DRAFT_582027 [Trichodelitschia bisporula]|uniref:Chromatin modification-related protein n=1 Tax=Trichodelitschia bisporula TaxID=703511 RepID=A0A6G1HYX3_9PEZI|nr:hypothetical protein EJ06DRAFT_582027 [Trichodelitschia bisporula]
MAAAVPNRRQSTRQVRSSTTRPQNYYARNFSGRAAGNSDPPPPTAQPGFFPAITHFTDTVDALPKEMIRHTSMLKEVEAKLHAPDAELRRLASAIEKLPPPPRNHVPLPSTNFSILSAHNSSQGSRGGSVAGGNTPLLGVPAGAESDADRERMHLFYQLNFNIHMMGPILDEKVAVLSTASQTLARQMLRLESSYRHVPDEVSEEARLGSRTHWAYITDKETKKTDATRERERNRRDVAGANNLAAAAAAVHEGDLAAARSEARREAMKKGRNHHADSDFDDRPARKSHAKKRAPEPDPKAVGLGIATAAPNKRRKTAATPAEKATPVQRAVASPRATPAAEPKKRAKPNPAPAKKRAQAAGLGSPHLASSPVVGPFVPKDLPAPPSRPGTSRGRQNSAANSTHSAPRPSSAASNKPLPAPIQAPEAAVQAPPAPAVVEALPETVAANPPEPAPLKEEPDPAPPEVDTPMPDASVTTTTTITTTARPSRGSKTATPISASFPDLPSGRGRGARGSGSNGGSHASSEAEQKREKRERGKRNGSHAAAAVAAAVAVEKEEVVVEPAVEAEVVPSAETAPPVAAAEEGEEGEIDEGEIDEGEGNEPRYCYCNDVSYGEMVACDNDGCKGEWFHLQCAGLTKAPAKDSKWYCNDCKGAVKERKTRPGSRRE